MSPGNAEIGGLCDQMLLRISSALDEALSNVDKAGLISHLETCPSCRVLSAEVGAVDRLFRALQNRRSAQTAPMEGFAHQVMKRVAVEKATGGGIAEFTRLVAQDEALQSQFRMATSMELFVNLFMRMGWQRGYCFSSGEVVKLLNIPQAANDDLSDEQLDAVVGGLGSTDTNMSELIGELFQRWSKPII